MCVIVRKSKPVTVLLSIEEYEKMKNKKTEMAKKLTLEEIRANSIFEKNTGSLDKTFGEISSVELAKKWTDYVD